MIARVVTAAVFLVGLAACAEHRRVLGEECLGNDDCQSKICSARVCVGEREVFDPPSLPAEPDAGVTGDAAHD